MQYEERCARAGRRLARGAMYFAWAVSCVVATGCGDRSGAEAPIDTAKSLAGAADVAAAATPTTVDDEFPVELTPPVGAWTPGPTKLRLTGSALRKKFGLRFYRIGSYCDAAHCTPVALPAGADSLIAVDCAKQLVLVMVREISASVLERSFADALAANDPQQKYAAESKRLLDHMLSAPMHEGQRVTLRHHPGRGMSCQVGDGERLHVDGLEFSRIVWSIYLGPKAVSPDLRTGLASRLGE